MKFAICCVLVIAYVATVVLSANEDCPKFCNMMFRPVCAKNSTGTVHTFSNECKMRAKNCYKKMDFVQIHEGKCTDDEKKGIFETAETPAISTDESVTEIVNGDEE